MRSRRVLVALAVSFSASAALAAPTPSRPAGWMPVEQLKAAAHEAGVQAIFRTWQKYITSTTHEAYPDYYGRHWDTVNRPQGTAAPAAPKMDETAKVTAPDPARLAKLTQTLAMTRAGRDALDIISRYGVKIEFIQNSSAGYFNPGKNFIALGDLRQDPEMLNTLLHELNHARTSNLGKAPDARKTPRQAYVDGKIDDEARGDALAAQAAREFARINRRAHKTGVKIDVLQKPTTQIYLDAYKQVISAGRAARQGKPAPALASAR